MLLSGYILVTCHKNNIVTLHVTFMLYRRNKTCLLGSLALMMRTSNVCSITGNLSQEPKMKIQY